MNFQKFLLMILHCLKFKIYKLGTHEIIIEIIFFLHEHVTYVSKNKLDSKIKETKFH